MLKQHITETMELLKNTYSEYKPKIIYRIELGPYISKFVNDIEKYRIVDEIMNNLNPDELFFIVFETMLTTMSDIEHIDDLEYIKYSQDEINFNLIEYLNIELDSGVLNIPSDLIDYISIIIRKNIDKDLVNNSIFTVGTYRTNLHSVIVDIHVKERLDI